ncbi:MAG: protein kinase [Deltaproteobacteria bacterium]|nr:protein kinase [Deltaproteobacteria bacterium]MBK8715725.1 protein kinase [Deltaproteobacteria bacterium]MBP7288196.1 protein kinase [Nannocystaceae bacterium]
MVERTEHWTPTPAHGTAVVARTEITEPAPAAAADATVDPVDPVEVNPRARLPRGLQRIGRYHVLKQLGEGGMGVVYSAFDEELDRRIAVKVLAADISVEFSGRTRLMREAQAMAKVSHPNVVHVYEVGEVQGHIFVAMEFVRGVTLREWLDRGGHGLAERLALLLQAGEGLAAAHASDIVHRDFKPENAMVGDDGRVRVLDFGLARSTGEVGDDEPDVRNTERTLDSFLPDRAGSVLSAQLTRHGSIMGTPAYMSPEQHFGTPTDARSDQFNFCVVLYEALYGERPFSGDNRLALAFAVRQGQIDPPPPRSEVPTKLREIILRGLRADPAERFPTMNALLAALRAATAPPRRRPAWLVASGALFLAAAAAGAAVMLRPQSTEAAPSAVQSLAADARLWASRAHWVYPDVREPEHTALRAVGSLRALEDATDGPGDLEADTLSREFADTLARLGDDYWEADGGRVFARDFYVQALLFDPTIGRARERSGVLAGEIAELRDRAERGGFTPEELAAAAELAELAAPVLASSEQTAPPERLASVMTSVRERAAKRRRERSHVGADAAATIVAAAAAPATPPPAVAQAVEPAVEPTADGELSPTTEVTPDGEPEANPDAKDPKLAREQAKEMVAQAKKLKAQGKREAALRKLFDATRIDRRYAPAFDALRDLHFQVGAYVEAVQYGEKAVKLSPGNGGYLLRLGEAQFKSKDYAAAERSWRAASALGVAQADDRLQALARTGSR